MVVVGCWIFVYNKHTHQKGTRLVAGSPVHVALMLTPGFAKLRFYYAPLYVTLFTEIQKIHIPHFPFTETVKMHKQAMHLNILEVAASWGVCVGCVAADSAHFEK